MRINEQRTFTMYLNEEEFEMMHHITESVPYGYRFDGEEFIITLTEDMLDDIQDLLNNESYVQEYEECNRYKAEKIRYLLDSIYMELE